jgi:hypothetical protein
MNLEAGSEMGGDHFPLIINYGSQTLAVHACNPSYSGGKRSGGSQLKAAWENSSRNSILKNLL